jgi:hypothetical protein
MSPLQTSDPALRVPSAGDEAKRPEAIEMK